MGRPTKGVLRSYPPQLLEDIGEIRGKKSGWGAISIRIELMNNYGYTADSLPSISGINRYLKSAGFIASRQPPGGMPTPTLPSTSQVHELWEVDAQGAVKVAGIGYQSMINMKDSLSRKYCMSFPVSVKNGKTQPRTLHYQWAFRLAFMESGRPHNVQVDKDSVFIENTSKSPFPSKLYLWLLALGVHMHFIKVSPPRKQAMVERSHQTLQKQVLDGQQYDNWQQLHQCCIERRKVLNEQFPCRTLGKKAPLQAFPEAEHSGRPYSIKTEAQLMDMNRVYDYLAQGKWYRKVAKNKTISLGGHVYYIKAATPLTTICITFCAKNKQLVFHQVQDKQIQIGCVNIKELSKQDLMGNDANNLMKMHKKIVQSKSFPI